jgi:hypothetical protein
MIQDVANCWGDPSVSTSAGFETTRMNILIRAARPAGDKLHVDVGVEEGAIVFSSRAVGDIVGDSVTTGDTVTADGP